MHAERVADGLHRLCTVMVNLYFVESPGGWVLVDAGFPGCTHTIRREAERLFDRPPTAILLTHGHFDHVGGLPALAEAWNVPVYAHRLELPYLTGRSSYPPPDPTVGGGGQSWMSPLFPRGPIDLGARARALPDGGAVPDLPGWQWLLTCGHSPGHVSFYRESDRALIAGDAAVTTKQESMLNVAVQREIVWRPPAYYTCDWAAARRSVETLAALEPEILATGHGHVLRGAAMRAGLRDLADRFDSLMPDHGRYIPYPAVTDERGVVHVPPRVGLAPNQVAAAAAIGAAALAVVWLRSRRETTGDRAAGRALAPRSV